MSSPPVPLTNRIFAVIHQSVRGRGDEFSNHSVALAENVKLAFGVNAEMDSGAAAPDLSVSRKAFRLSSASWQAHSAIGTGNCIFPLELAPASAGESGPGAYRPSF